MTGSGASRDEAGGGGGGGGGCIAPPALAAANPVQPAIETALETPVGRNAAISRTEGLLKREQTCSAER